MVYEGSEMGLPAEEQRLAKTVLRPTLPFQHRHKPSTHDVVRTILEVDSHRNGQGWNLGFGGPGDICTSDYNCHVYV